VNGLYEVTDEISGGMPVYKKQRAELWLEYHVSLCQWMLKSTASKGQENNATCAYVACDVGVLPDKAPRGAWHVAFFFSSLAAQASVVVTRVSASEAAVEEAAFQAACAKAQAEEAAEVAVKVRKRVT